MKSITPAITFLKENGKHLLFSLLTLRAIVLGPNLACAIIIVAFLAYFALEKFLKQKQQPTANGQLIEEVEKLKGRVGQLTLGSLYAKK